MRRSDCVGGRIRKWSVNDCNKRVSNDLMIWDLKMGVEGFREVERVVWSGNEK